MAYLITLNGVKIAEVFNDEAPPLDGIPQGAIPISDEQFQAMSGDHSHYEWNGIDVVYVEPSATDAELKMIGVEFEGVMCSAMKEDQWGLSSIKEWIVAGNTVGFEFENGNVLPLSAANIAAFEIVWITFRESFFQ